MPNLRIDQRVINWTRNMLKSRFIISSWGIGKSKKKYKVPVIRPHRLDGITLELSNDANYFGVDSMIIMIHQANVI